MEEQGLTVEPLEDLKEDQDLLRRMDDIFEVVHYRIKEEVYQKVLGWIDEVTNTLDQEIHHKKKGHHLIRRISKGEETLYFFSSY